MHFHVFPPTLFSCGFSPLTPSSSPSPSLSHPPSPEAASAGSILWRKSVTHGRLFHARSQAGLLRSPLRFDRHSTGHRSRDCAPRGSSSKQRDPIPSQPQLACCCCFFFLPPFTTIYPSPSLVRGHTHTRTITTVRSFGGKQSRDSGSVVAQRMKAREGERRIEFCLET